MRERCGKWRDKVGDSQRRENILVKNIYKLLQYHLTSRLLSVNFYTSCYSTILHIRWYCSNIVKKFTINSPDEAWFLCFDGKICQHMTYGSASANAHKHQYCVSIQGQTLHIQASSMRPTQSLNPSPLKPLGKLQCSF